ncbi:hypothetical protein A3A39_00540 [Candidatus Kaiserbacteria bacterium RIFCSPLOWO2_01_FULL_54_13]|uniref:Glutamine amidotransferase domain-containing protein n=1 Tax=Candidatus Kaiserbacteria bacterium RIFCSPLOWO2_01_FULL_54_13 TaxID=1798512 RepID=A0A1F6F0I9_9BACT|nr:MAG: hypothetical protein A3A39_00540 [Candidatus Kaiserbacteria bacterium RIFCSPLOWO2_01_FULL_54_13]
MKRILVIQSRERKETVEAEQEEYCRVVEPLARVDFLSALDEKLAWTDPDEVLKEYGGIIIGGSGDFDLHGGRFEKDPARLMAMIILSRLRMFVKYAFAEELPVFGVCFGHQLIAQMHGGNVTRDETQTKTGTFEVCRTEEGKRDLLFKGLPDAFLVQYAHKDSVMALPQGAVLLATGPMCRFGALRYGKATYTTQFHPELSAERAIRKLNRDTCGYMPEGIADAASIVRESPEASQLIPAWIERVVT